MFEDITAQQAVHFFMSFYVDDNFIEHLEHRDKARAAILREMSTPVVGYDYTEDFGRSNDNFGARSNKPLPYIKPTPQTEDGYVGLMPPLA